MLSAVCGRYTNTTAPHELGERYGVPISSAEGTGRFNVAPTEQVLTVVAKNGERRAELMRWGLVPSWATELKGPLMINARLESVMEKPAYRRLVPRAERRALQLADGYFEWLKPERRGEPRQPFYFQLDGGKPFAFAALWTPARVEGEWLHSCALLTCDSSPNRTAAAIHDRMPVVLADEDAQRAWLDPEVGAEEALALCGPLPEARLSARPVNPAVNKVDPETEGPQLLVAPG
jgi:putative SOS response-associated peptidase YedK